jgi:hypothetical protein
VGFWKDDWEQTKRNFVRWWRGDGFVFCVSAPARHPHEAIEQPVRPNDQTLAWIDPAYRFRRAEHLLSQTFFGGDAFPYYDTHVGPGSLGMFLGSEPNLTTRTVWYNPCIEQLATYPKLALDRENRWWRAQIAMLDYGMRHARGRFLVSMPDLIENIDTLAQLCGSETMLLDLIERPAVVMDRLWQINDAFFEAFDAMHAIIKDVDGGNCFSAFQIWGPGRTAKVQCDAAAMISPAMFRQFVVPPLAAQCAWLDNALFHLDGVQAICHLDALLEIESVDAIQWTPQAGLETPGHLRWHDLYRRIQSANKGVQALHVDYNDVIPLLDAVGPKGMYIGTTAESQESAEMLIERVHPYRL